MSSYNEIKTSVDPLKDAKLNEMFDKMEYGLTYVGGSAIEDKL